MAANSQFSDTVAVVDRTDSGRTDATPAGHGLGRFLDVVGERGHSEVVSHWTLTDADPLVLVGPTDDPLVGRLLDAEVSDPESVVYEWQTVGQREALIVAGTDDRGLMYALLELADRVDGGGIDALAAVENTVETPDNRVRGVDRFLEDPVEDDWFYDDAFWEYYLSRLARYRFNRLVLTTGYISDFMSPPYPFLVDVPGYPDVELTDEVEVSREETFAQLRRIGRLCDAYGIEFVFATWQQQPGEGGRLVAGLPEGTDLTEYCAEGMYQLLTQCPEIEGVQLRVNWEAGVSSGEQLDYDLDRAEGTAESFWRGIVDAVDAAVEDRDHDRDVHLDLRAKGLTDGLIEYAVETGLDVTVPTKFWCESTGLPYHNSRMRSEELAHLEDPNKARRYGYADFLGDSRAYDVLYRLWSIGTNRVFVWGDPDYGRRFGESAGFGDAAGFEVTPPLSVKGGAADGEGWSLFDDPDLRDYEYEDERYWAWYLTFGRFGYSTDADQAVWTREFERRFDGVADAVQEGYRAASKLLPLVTAAHLTRHPATSNWAELDTGGALFGEHNSNPRLGDVSYAAAEPSDPGLFYGVDEYVADRESDEVDRRYTPPQIREWYLSLAREIRAAVDRIGDDHSGELRATLLDLRMLADLAEFHASQTTAATGLAAYQRGADAGALCEAYRHARWSVDVWERLAERGEGTYHSDLSFIIDDRGQWRDYLGDLEADLDRLEELLDAEGIDPGEVRDALSPDAASDRPHAPSFSFPTASVDVPGRCVAGRDVPVAIRTGEYGGLSDFRVHYRRANQYEGDFETVEMVDDGHEHRASVPGEYVTGEFDLLVYVTALDDTGEPVVVPGVGHAEEPFPYRVVETVAEPSTDRSTADE